MKFFTACNSKNLICNVLNKMADVLGVEGIVSSELKTFRRGITAKQSTYKKYYTGKIYIHPWSEVHLTVGYKSHWMKSYTKL
jgi:hypothetical protein